MHALARRGLPICLGAALFLLVLWGADRLFPPDMTRAADQALLLQDRHGEMLDGRVSRDGAWRLATTRGSVDPRYVALLLRVEDARYWAHFGIDPFALTRAAFQLVRHGHVVSGGSTLAMQTARLLTPHRHSLRGKIQDMARAVQLEWRYGHAGVLDLYLTLAPESRNIEGIRAATLLWFGHEPLHLSNGEAALLIAMARHPWSLRPDRHPDAARAAVSELLRRYPMPDQVPGMLGRYAPSYRLVPTSIPHDAHEVLTWQWNHDVRGVSRVSIDRHLQNQVRDILLHTAPPAGGTWAVLVAHRSGDIVAWRGNAGNDCAGCAGDMITAWRSPGSTLKPAIYGMAFQLGLLAPDTLVQDRATRFGAYAPRNYDRVFHGTTTVRKALQHSYNLPAVWALDKVGASYFAGTLDAAGIGLRFPAGTSPSLALALGGVGVRPLDLARLYAAFANNGLSYPLTLDWPAELQRGTRLIGPAASREILSILAGTPLPQGRIESDDMRVAFKTGTSYGQRDAWAAGVRGDWIVVAWGGRPDGTAVPGITGLTTTAPVLLQIFDGLPAEGDARTAERSAPAFLSPSLRRAHSQSGPHIVQPGNGGVVECFSENGEATPLGLLASGGVEPYRWFVNGAPLDIPFGLTPAWKPQSPGFVHIALVDATGAGSAVDIRVR